MTTAIKMLSLCSATATLVVQLGQSHVVLKTPPGRTNNDYIYTFDGSCDGNSCDKFCGEQAVEQYEGTKDTFRVLEAGKLTTISWYSPQVHQPYKFRLALSRGPSDSGFDRGNNELAMVDNPQKRIGDFSVTDVCIPTDYAAVCGGDNGPCVLQLYDMYYFVSCTNVKIVNATTFDEACVPNANANPGPNSNPKPNPTAPTPTELADSSSETQAPAMTPSPPVVTTVNSSDTESQQALTTTPNPTVARTRYQTGKSGASSTLVGIVQAAFSAALVAYVLA